MPVTFDKVLAGQALLHKHNASDIVDIPNKFVNITGDTMTGRSYHRTRHR